jgi:RNA polymerase sigma factor (sigma-70 family)
MEPSSQLHSQFQTAYESYADELFGFCCSKVRYREEALDIVHDSFVKYWGALTSRIEILNPKAYLYSIVRNKIIDHYRSVAVHRVFPLEQELIDTLADTSTNQVNEADLKIILKSINQLPDSYREPILFRYVDGMAVSDIAVLLSASPGAITKRLKRGIELLRREHAPH